VDRSHDKLCGTIANNGASPFPRVRLAECWTMLRHAPTDEDCVCIRTTLRGQRNRGLGDHQSSAFISWRLANHKCKDIRWDALRAGASSAGGLCKSRSRADHKRPQRFHVYASGWSNGRYHLGRCIARSPSVINTLRGMRIVVDGFFNGDDLRLFILHPTAYTSQHLAHISKTIRELIWDKVSTLKQFTVGLSLWLHRGYLSWLPASWEFYHTLLHCDTSRNIPSSQHSLTHASPKITACTPSNHASQMRPAAAVTSRSSSNLSVSAACIYIAIANSHGKKSTSISSLDNLTSL
jgi:hypothetical protein